MEQIELVVKIPKDVYEDYWHLGSYELRKIISNGTPLPKGHGRLVDENDLVKDFNTFQCAFAINMAKGGFRVVCTAKTIVEADKEGAEE